MPVIGRKMPNYTILARFKHQIWSSWAQKLKLNIHRTKSPKHDHIYKYGLEEHIHKCLILIS